MSNQAIFTTELCNRIANYAKDQISNVKLIVNDVAQNAVIKKKEVVDDVRLQIYVDLNLQSSDVLNGIELYDNNNVLLAKTKLNLNYLIQQATYLFQIDFYSDNILSTFSLLGGK